MAWIEVHQSLFTHHKTVKLTRLMGETNTASIAGHLISLWSWAMDNAPEGELTEFDSLLISVSSGFKTRKQGLKWISALIESGFVDKDEDGRLWIHNWALYIGRLNDKRDKRKEDGRRRSQEYRDRKKAASRVTGCDGDASTVPDRNPTPPNTRPEPDTTSPPTPSRGRERENFPPSVEDVKEFAEKAGLDVDAAEFIRVNSAHGWTDSHGKAIRDWKLWLIGTAKRQKEVGKDGGTGIKDYAADHPGGRDEYGGEYI